MGKDFHQMEKRAWQAPKSQELVNEGWLWHFVLDGFRRHPEIQAIMDIVDRFLREGSPRN
jgi:hypothetical protein